MPTGTEQKGWRTIYVGILAEEADESFMNLGLSCNLLIRKKWMRYFIIIGEIDPSNGSGIAEDPGFKG
jgi:hypothetical protein